MKILGVHIGHDSSAALIEDGRILADASEERFNRIKHYGGMPLEAIRFCLRQAKLDLSEVNIIAYSGSLQDPLIKVTFQLTEEEMRQLFTQHYGTSLNLPNLKRLLKEKTFARYHCPPDYIQVFKKSPHTRVIKVDHHLAHAASAYYTSGFNGRCLVVTSDGAGDAYSMCVYLGEQGRLRPLKQFGHSGSLGWFYGIVTEGLDWWIGDGEGKTMGLAPYGRPDAFPDALLEEFMPRYVQGELKQPYQFANSNQLTWMDTYHWHFQEAKTVKKLIGQYGREQVAAKAQHLLEREMMSFLSAWVQREKATHLATAGGLFLNVKLNQKVVESHMVEDYFIFPNASDAGLAVGAALYVHYAQTQETQIEPMGNLYWGPEYGDEMLQPFLEGRNLRFRRCDDICREASQLLAQGKIVSWFQGRMESGPRALGTRSILFDPRLAENKDIINAKVKFREPFRPFCPSMIYECAQDYLYETRDERYMITAYRVRPEMAARIPAVVHVDGTCRPQFIHRLDNPKYWDLVHHFGELTGTPVLLNTSFNIKGEPIVCTPGDAVKCFYDSGIDAMALGSFLLEK
jgi:carbamoyltransferase